ncbi:MAG: FAD-binding oxidoreductase [Candidatus Eremiobacteraeota bacterium]|nr:FAD-binding oxidoreductase [Candidatus Eremiobacteraeota bacterium]
MITTASVAIVGGGVMGCSLAYHLTALGVQDVVLLERQGICSGETAKSGGFVQTHWSSSHEVRLIHWSRGFFQEWAQACQYQPIGYLHVTGAEKEPSVRETHEMLLQLGFESNWLSPREIKKLQPLLRVDDLSGGTYEPSSGWAHPVATTRFFAEGARQRGASLLEGVRVLQIAQRSGKIQGVETDQGFLSAPVVVLAAGPWSLQLHPNPALPLPLLNKRGQVCYMNRPAGLPRKELAFYDEVTGLYTHPDGDTNLVGLDWHFEPVFGPDHYDGEIDQDYLEGAHGALSHRFPSMAQAQPIKGLVGLYDFTPDGHPIVDGPLGLEGYYVMAGFSGAGFKSSPALGLGLAELIVHGQYRTVNLDFLKLSRFRC